MTEDILASLVGQAFGQSHTPLNILSGFKKTGIYPFNHLVAFSEDEDQFWVCCDVCNEWVCFACHKFSTTDSVPDRFYCVQCVNCK